MKEHGDVEDVIHYWLEKSKESLDSATDELTAGRLSFAVNRIYYSCFYTVSALLLKKGLKFKKHSGVRAAFHQYCVKTGLLANEFGLLYDELYEARQRGDYLELVGFERQQVEEWLTRARDFVESVGTLIDKETSGS